MANVTLTSAMPYEGLTADDMPDADVPAQFTDTADIWDYQAGYEAGYESHWADLESDR